jgi:hypothetical protein
MGYGADLPAAWATIANLASLRAWRLLISAAFLGHPGYYPTAGP